jgi:hypothetical protein
MTVVSKAELAKLQRLAEMLHQELAEDTHEWSPHGVYVMDGDGNEICEVIGPEGYNHAVAEYIAMLSPAVVLKLLKAARPRQTMTRILDTEGLVGPCEQPAARDIERISEQKMLDWLSWYAEHLRRSDDQLPGCTCRMAGALLARALGERAKAIKDRSYWLRRAEDLAGLADEWIARAERAERRVRELDSELQVLAAAKGQSI